MPQSVLELASIYIGDLFISNKALYYLVVLLISIILTILFGIIYYV